MGILRGMTRPATKEEWEERVREWKESGESAAGFATGKGFSVSSLRNWATQLSSAPTPRARQWVQLVRKEHATGPVTAAAATRASSSLVVEIGEARVRVEAGFDRVLLVQVLRALGGER